MITEKIIIKNWRNVDFSFGLVYPNIFKLGMSSYSIRLLYFLINSFENIACERIFLPENIKLKFPASKDYSSKSLLRSIENRIMPNKFDILGFSIHFENDFKNILWILEKAEIPLTFQERQELINEGQAQVPIVIAGGPVVTSNPIPLSKFFDIMFIGDSENNLKSFFQLFQTYIEQKVNLSGFLAKVSEIEGIYVPTLKNKVSRAILQELDDSPNPIIRLTSKESREKKVFESNFLIEINRGCPYQCKFCISSFHNSPFRNRSFENVTKAIEDGIKYSNFNTISLIGSCVSSHPKFIEICEFIQNSGKRLTIPSIRIEHLSPEIIHLLENANIKTITIAPETGSESLRSALGKKISNEKIYSVLQQIRASRIKNVKFYFLIGLPNEVEENIDDIINLLKSIDKLGFERNALRVNINPFVPKLNTPYEKEIFYYLEDNLKELINKYQKLEKELKKLRSIKIKFKNFKFIVKNARLQAMISLGNQNVSDILLHYYFNNASFSALRKAERALDFYMDDYLLKIKNCFSPWLI